MRSEMKTHGNLPMPLMLQPRTCVYTSVMNKTLYFPGLNTLRWFAALSVVVHHLVLYPKQWFGMSSYPNPIEMLVLSGWDAVTLFFVLSGFLITYLLLNEHSETGKVDIRHFYWRRVIRIWPVYFLVIGLSAAAALLPSHADRAIFAPFSDTGIVAALVFAFNIYFGLNEGATSIFVHLWSIGVEEQFYLFWPWLVKIRRNLWLMFVGVILVKWSLFLLISISIDAGYSTAGVLAVLQVTRFECMAVGGLGAYIVFFELPLLRWLYWRPVQFTAWFVFAVILFIPAIEGNPAYDFLASVTFLIVILNTATGVKPIFNLEMGVTTKMGMYSYGIYMYHPLVIFMLLSLGINGSSLFIATIIITSGIAYLSYQWVERPFLSLKHLLAPKRPVYTNDYNTTR